MSKTPQEAQVSTPSNSQTFGLSQSNSEEQALDQELAELEAKVRNEIQSKKVPEAQWEKDDDVAKCPACNSEFTLFFRRVHCRFCGRVYCRNCCFSKNPLDAREPKRCVPCVQHEMQAVEDARQMKRFQDWQIRFDNDMKAQFAALTADEDAKRNEGKREEARLRSRFASKLQFLKDEDTARKVESEKKEAKSNILDRWAAIKPSQPRQGALTLTVVRAINVAPPSRLLLHCSPLVAVRHNRDEHESEYKYHDACPEFDFEAHFVVENDLQPIVVTLFDDRGLGVKLFIGNTAINLRAPYKNLIKNVDTYGIYSERGSVIQSVYGDEGKQVGNCTVECHWKLVLREVEEEAFCELCGRLAARCECSPEEQAELRAKMTKEMLEKEQAIQAEKRKRIEREHQEAEAKAARAERQRQKLEAAAAAALAEKQRRADKRQNLLDEREKRRKRRENGEVLDPSENDEEVDNTSKVTAVAAADDSAPSAESQKPVDLTHSPTAPHPSQSLDTNDSMAASLNHEPITDKDGNPIAERTDGEAGKKQEDGCCCLVQ